MKDQIISQPLRPDTEYLSGWRKNALLVVLFLVSAFGQIDHILPYILAESIKAELHLTDTQLGLITGIAFALIYSLTSLPLARLSDRGASKTVLVWCILIWSGMAGLGGLAVGFTTLALSRLGVALGEAGGTPASHALIVRKIPERIRGRAIGIFSMGIPLGTMIGFGLGGWANDHIGWRAALFAAGAIGLLIAVAVMAFSGKTMPMAQTLNKDENFWSSAKELLLKPAYLWMFVGANLIGFAAAPFYSFTAPLLIRTHGLTASQVGISFGLLQGLMGILGTVIGGRSYDRSMERGNGRLLDPPALVFCIAAITTLAGLFAPVGWLAIALFVPGMLSFAFVLPYAFGAGHMLAGPGKQALSSSIMMIASGLLGPALSPVLVGLISDSATASHVGNGLRLGMLIVPLASLLSGIACFVASGHIRTFLAQMKTPEPRVAPQLKIIEDENFK